MLPHTSATAGFGNWQGLGSYHRPALEMDPRLSMPIAVADELYETSSIDQDEVGSQPQPQPQPQKRLHSNPSKHSTQSQPCDYRTEEEDKDDGDDNDDNRPPSDSETTSSSSSESSQSADSKSSASDSQKVYTKQLAVRRRRKERRKRRQKRDRHADREQPSEPMPTLGGASATLPRAADHFWHSDDQTTRRPPPSSDDTRFVPCARCRANLCGACLAGFALAQMPDSGRESRGIASGRGGGSGGGSGTASASHFSRPPTARAAPTPTAMPMPTPTPTLPLAQMSMFSLQNVQQKTSKPRSRQDKTSSKEDDSAGGRQFQLWIWDVHEQRYLRTTSRFEGKTPGVAARKAVGRGARAFALVEPIASSGAMIYMYIGDAVPVTEEVHVGGRHFTRRSKAVANMWKKLSIPLSTHADVANLVARYPPPTPAPARGK